ncbi:hypothetical protein AVEN_125057-1 [Araneus ventricosus]|uniref:Uncharacterized protein n=1 Tax=Araneus ventricosus TaxID=182803 RepID=A0A4Y2GRY8_ARAVE|nr:hypothetical protein AVEN_125057-1 [Araneus ventricosus]
MINRRVNIGLTRSVWTFIIAGEASPIIGADFLKHFNLLIDLRKRRHLSLPLVQNLPTIYTSCGCNFRFQEFLLLEFPDITNTSLIGKSATRGSVHHITSRPPVKIWPRNLHQKLYDGVKAEFEFLLVQGIIRPSKSL